MSYENVKFGNLSPKRKETVREQIAQMWADGHTTDEVSKKVRISKGSVATAFGNFERLVEKPKSKKAKRVK